MMNKRRIVWVLIVVFSVAVSVAVAGNTSGGSSGGGQGTGGNDTAQNDSVKERTQDRLMVNENNCDNDPIQSRDRTQDRVKENTSEEPEPGYLTKDGEAYQWNHRFTKKSKQYEGQDNPDALNRYLNRIAKMNRFKDQKDVDGFVQWALKNRPWDVN
jgi:hypothetical protein